MSTRENLHVHYSADLYDRYTSTFVRAYDDMAVARVLQEKAARPPGPGVLLDVGAGTCQLLIRLAHHEALAGWRFVALDFFQDMVDQAREAARQQGVADRIEIVQGDAHALPYDDASADLVISRSTVHHWSDPAQALREIGRVLKPGGVAIIQDVRRDPAPDALAEFNRLRAEAGVEPSRLAEKYTVAEVREFVRQAGIEAWSTIVAPESGAAGLGFELRIHRPA